MKKKKKRKEKNTQKVKQNAFSLDDTRQDAKFQGNPLLQATSTTKKKKKPPPPPPLPAAGCCCCYFFPSATWDSCKNPTGNRYLFNVRGLKKRIPTKMCILFCLIKDVLFNPLCVFEPC